MTLPKRRYPSKVTASRAPSDGTHQQGPGLLAMP